MAALESKVSRISFTRDKGFETEKYPVGHVDLEVTGSTPELTFNIAIEPCGDIMAEGPYYLDFDEVVALRNFLNREIWAEDARRISEGDVVSEEEA